MTLFLRLQEQLLPHASPGLRAFLIGVGKAIPGHNEWAQKLVRYAIPGSPSTVWALQPATASLKPLSIPSISWWWDQLDH
jgi:hypothetical protein